MDAERQNREFFDNYILIPPTRPLQTDPIGGVHNIDEWFDEAIGRALHWYSTLIRFDIFIVNYVYLSKAFEYLKQHPLKVLDTHDKFSNRHKMLAAAGIPPEYFYTSEEQEAQGVSRADLVWAIKDEEREYFSRITNVPVVTCPSPLHVVAKNKKQREEFSDKLVVGYLGARNSVNKQSLIPFLNALIEADKYHAAPFELKIFGNIVRDLGAFAQHPKIQLLGFLDEVTDFYEQVDVSINPVEHSSGQKIKSIEAVEYEMPQLLTHNAAEGVMHNQELGVYQNAEQLLEAMLNLAFEQKQLKQLQNVATKVKADLNIKATNALKNLQRMVLQRPSVALLVSCDEQKDATMLYLENMEAKVVRLYTSSSTILRHIVNNFHKVKYLELLFINDFRASLIPEKHKIPKFKIHLLNDLKEAFVFGGDKAYWQKHVPDINLVAVQDDLDDEIQNANKRASDAKNSSKATHVLCVISDKDLGIDFIVNSFVRRDAFEIAWLDNFSQLNQWLSKENMNILTGSQNYYLITNLETKTLSRLDSYSQVKSQINEVKLQGLSSISASIEIF